VAEGWSDSNTQYQLQQQPSNPKRLEAGKHLTRHRNTPSNLSILLETLIVMAVLLYRLVYTSNCRLNTEYSANLRRNGIINLDGVGKAVKDGRRGLHQTHYTNTRNSV
jgi:hypothetical protein